jgi:hypothetical protein
MGHFHDKVKALKTLITIFSMNIIFIFIFIRCCDIYSFCSFALLTRTKEPQKIKFGIVLESFETKNWYQMALKNLKQALCRDFY